MKEIDNALRLPLDQDFFVSLEQSKKEDYAVFSQVGIQFAIIGRKKYEVKPTGRPIEGLIPFKSPHRGYTDKD